ncbi:MAG TPA: hypothetical protein VF607_11340 [Verrucomicrobiae bacterium]
MIQFLHVRGHHYTLRPVLKASTAPAIRLQTYDSFLRARSATAATHVFLDLDRLDPWSLQLAADLYRQLQQAGVRVLNDPARVKNRYALLRALYRAGLNDFNIWRADEAAGVDRFPVFLRTTHGHAAPVSGLLPDAAALAQAIESLVTSGTPLENLLVISYVGEPVRPGLYRKESAFIIGDQVIPHESVHDDQWLVKYGKLGIGTPELYQEELTAMQNNPHAAHLQKVFALAGITYGRADFGFYQGRLQVYEVNGNPSVYAPSLHPSPLRTQSLQIAWEKYLAGLRAVDDTPPGPKIKLRDGAVQRRRAWKNLLVLSRKVP